MTSSAGYDAFPVWSPDGRHIAFTSSRNGGAQNRYWMRADGGGEAVRLSESPFAAQRHACLPHKNAFMNVLLRGVAENGTGTEQRIH
jgi:Tol biopolymer transport system component